MEAKSWIMLRVLLNRFHQAASEATLRCLPREEAQAILRLDVSGNNPSLILANPLEKIQKIHYSWLIPAIESLPKTLHSTLLEALPPNSAAKLESLLKPAKPTHATGKALASPIRTFLLNSILSHLPHNEALPLSLLPQTVLTPLAEWNKNDLIELIDFLGLYDLAEEMRQIIDQKRLKQLYICLSKKKRPFLHTCLRQKEKISSPRLDLGTWTGDCRKLDQLLHRRGLLRLGKALCGQHPDLIWHLIHLLDTGRGKLIEKYYSPAVVTGVTPVLVQQVVSVMNFLQPRVPRE